MTLFRNIFPVLMAAQTSLCAATTVLVNPVADAFVSSASASTNYGSQGTLAVAGADSGKGIFQSVLRFNLASAASQFNTDYGPGNWSISSMSLTFASNVGTQGGVPANSMFPVVNGGMFAIDWMQDDSWGETTITYNNLNLHTGVTTALGAWNYVPPGNNVAVKWSLAADSSLVTDAAAGGNVSFLVSPAASTVAYLFNSRSYNAPTNIPVLEITAIPEPTAPACVAVALISALIHRRRL
jgi:hypothetical protein